MWQDDSLRSTSYFLPSACSPSSRGCTVWISLHSHNQSYQKCYLAWGLQERLKSASETEPDAQAETIGVVKWNGNDTHNSPH